MDGGEADAGSSSGWDERYSQREEVYFNLIRVKLPSV
jgi:hypothetical protein